MVGGFFVLCALTFIMALPAGAHETVETVRDTLDPDFAAGKSAVEGRNWRGAIDSFGKVADAALVA